MRSYGDWVQMGQIHVTCVKRWDGEDLRLPETLLLPFNELTLSRAHTHEVSEYAASVV